MFFLIFFDLNDESGGGKAKKIPEKYNLKSLGWPTLVDSPPGKLQPMPITAMASSLSTILTENLIHWIISSSSLVFHFQNLSSSSPELNVIHAWMCRASADCAAPVADSYRPPLYQSFMHGCIRNHGDEGVHCTSLSPRLNRDNRVHQVIRRIKRSGLSNDQAYQQNERECLR